MALAAIFDVPRHDLSFGMLLRGMLERPFQSRIAVFIAGIKINRRFIDQKVAHFNIAGIGADMQKRPVIKFGRFGIDMII